MEPIGVLTIYFAVCVPVFSPHYNRRWKQIILFKRQNVTQNESKRMFADFRQHNAGIVASEIRGQWQVDPVLLD